MNELLTFFGFKRFPFDKNIKSKEIFISEAIEETKARLEFIKLRLGIMIFSGDPGVGKTVSLRNFVDNLNQNLYKSIYTQLSTLNRIDILRHINEKLGLPTRAAKSAVFTQIQKEILESREQRGRTVVLAIDEAHLLKVGTLQEIRLLTNFKMDSFDPFILILSGQTELKRIMEFSIMEPFVQRLAIRYHMPPLSIEETAEYIRHHLKLVGCTQPIFSDDAMKALYEVSFGIPRKIGNFATDALTYAMFDGKRTVDANTVLKVRTGD